MQKENLSTMPAITITRTFEINVNWEEGEFGYTEERLNTTRSGVTLRARLDTLMKKLLDAKTEQERLSAFNEVGLSDYDNINADMAADFVKHDLKPEKPKPQPPHLHQIFVGVAPQPGSLHSPTISEILYQANQPRPTTPYFKQTDQGPRVVNPMEPYTDFSHDIPQTVDPRQPPYHNPTQGG